MCASVEGKANWVLTKSWPKSKLQACQSGGEGLSSSVPGTIVFPRDKWDRVSGRIGEIHSLNSRLLLSYQRKNSGNKRNAIMIHPKQDPLHKTYHDLSAVDVDRELEVSTDFQLPSTSTHNSPLSDATDIADNIGAMSSSYRLRGRKVVEESFHFINSESEVLSDDSPRRTLPNVVGRKALDRTYSDSRINYVDPSGVQNMKEVKQHWDDSASLILGEDPDSNFPDTYMVRMVDGRSMSETEISDRSSIDLRLRTGNRRMSGVDGNDSSFNTNSSNRGYVEYRDSTGTVYAVFARKETDGSNPTIETTNGRQKVSFDQTVQLVGNRKESFYLGKLKDNPHSPTSNYYSTPSSPPSHTYYSADAIERMNSVGRSEQVDFVFADNPANQQPGVQNEELEESPVDGDYYFDEDGLPTDRPPPLVGSRKAGNGGWMEQFSQVTTEGMDSARATLGYTNGGFHHEGLNVEESMTVLEEGAKAPPSLPHPHHDTQRRTGQRLFLAILCMIFVLTLTGIGIGLTIYFD